MLRVWVFIAFLLATLCGFALAGRDAYAFPLTGGMYDTRGALTESVLAVLASRPIFKEDVGSPDEKRAQLELVAPAISEASSGDPFIAALLIAVGDAETHWSLRIWKNLCRPLECDRGRARGLWQGHQNAFVNAEAWATLGTPTAEGTALGALRAANLLRYGRHVCGPVPDCILRVYAGKGARSNWSGLTPRLATFESARRRL